MKKPKKLFLHRLISKVIAHSLYENKSRNFARRSYTAQYLQTITYQLILFASTAIKYALDCKYPFRKESSVQFHADSYKGMCYHPGSWSVLLSEQLSEREFPAYVLFTRTILRIWSSMGNYPAQHSKEDLRNPSEAHSEDSRRGVRRWRWRPGSYVG